MTCVYMYMHTYMHIIVSNCKKALVYIGGVASAVIFPLGLLILIYHYCCERQAKEKGMYCTCTMHEQYMYMYMYVYVLHEVKTILARLHCRFLMHKCLQVPLLAALLAPAHIHSLSNGDTCYELMRHIPCLTCINCTFFICLCQ